MTKIFVLRHGQTDYNLQDRFTGSINVGLNREGFRQAKCIAEQLINYNIDIIISSPLKRAQQTALIISNKISKPIITKQEFSERCIGVFEGLTKHEAKNKYPNMWDRNITRIFNNAPTGGETIKQVQNRVFSGLNETIIKYKDKNILIVTHAFTSKIIYRYFYGSDLKELSKHVLENSEIVQYML